MSRCCPHREDEHHIMISCQEVVHYPSEDYPCLCHEYRPEGPEGRCAGCNHPARSHGEVRVCRPADGQVCGCQSAV